MGVAKVSNKASNLDTNKKTAASQEVISIVLDMLCYTILVDSLVPMFKALGDPTRARIFEFLCAKCSPVAVDSTGEFRPLEGVTVGEVCCQVTGSERFSSTVSFHLKELRLAGLINAEKKGKYIVCSVRRESLNALCEYFRALDPCHQHQIPELSETK